MSIRQQKAWLIAAALAAGAAGSGARADTDPPAPANLLVLGASTSPEYEGSEDFAALPVIGARFDRGFRYLSALGTTVTVNLADRAGVEFGPVLNYAFGRDAAVDNPTIAMREEIDTTVE